MDHLLSRLDEASSSDVEARSVLYQEVRDAAQGDFEVFARSVRALPLAAPSCLFEVYEALAPVSAKHADFFVAEVRRLLEAQESGANGRHPADALEAVTLIEDRDVRDRITKELISRSNSRALSVRRSVSWLLPSFANAEVGRSILESFATDTDWRIRVTARWGLNEYDGLPLNTGVRLADKVRLKLYGHAAG